MSNKTIENFKIKEDLIYKTIISNTIFFQDLPFGKKNILNLFETLSFNDEKISSELLKDNYLNQHLNNVLSRLALNNELLRIQKGLYSFSSNLIDFKISLENDFYNLLIKDIVAEKKLLNSEAIILEKNIFVPEYLVNEKLHLQEKEIFFKKFRQYKIIQCQIKDSENVKLYSLAKFYNSKSSNKKDYIKNSYSLLESGLEKFQDKKNNVFNRLLKDSKKNQKDFNFENVSNFIKELKKEIEINAK